MKISKNGDLVKYLFVFCIPIILVGLLLYGNMVLNSRRENERLQQASLEQVAEAMDMLKECCDTLADRAQADAALISRLDAQKDNAFIKQWLSTSEDLFSFPVTLALYHRSSLSIYTREGIMAYETFAQQTGDLSASLAGLYSSLNRLSKRQSVTLLRNTGDIYSIAYLYPLMNEQAILSNCLCVLVPVTTLESLFAIFFDASKASITIINDAGQPLLMSPIDYTLLKTFRSLRGEGVAQAPDGHSVVIRYTSPQSNQRYFVTIDQAVLYQHGDHWWMLVPLIALCVLCAGSLAVLLARSQRIHLRVAQEENTMLNNALNDHARIIRELVLAKLIDSTRKEERRLRYDLQCAHLVLDRPDFYIGVFSFEAAYDLDQLKRGVHPFCRSAVMEAETLEVIDQPGDNQLILLANLDAADSQQRIQDIMQALYDRLSDLHPEAGISQTHHNLFQLNTALVEANVAIQEKMKGPRLHIWQFAVPVIGEASFGSLLVEEALLAECIRYHNETMLISNLRRLFERIAQTEVKGPLFQCQCYNAINMCSELMTSFGHPLDKGNLTDLCVIEDTQALCQAITELLLQLCRSVQQQENEKLNASKYHLLEFVQEHFRDPALSLTMISDALGLSQPYISKLFKDETGQNFVAYVRQLRFVWVQRELSDTDRPVKDIVLDSGYMDVANFSRSFKAFSGVTPVEYRRQSQARRAKELHTRSEE